MRTNIAAWMGVVVGAVVIVLMARHRLRRRRFLDVGTVSAGWLAEHRGREAESVF